MPAHDIFVSLVKDMIIFSGYILEDCVKDSVNWKVFVCFWSFHTIVPAKLTWTILGVLAQQDNTMNKEQKAMNNIFKIAIGNKELWSSLETK